jgi:Domain of unknown function (DUF4157)
MLERKIARAPVKESNTPARNHPTAMQHRRPPARTTPPTARQTGIAWDFARIPVHPQGRERGLPSEPLAFPAGLQRKLEIGAVDDPLEHEADRIADDVMSGQESPVSVAASPLRISRKCTACEQDEDREPGLLQRAPESGATAGETAGSGIKPSTGGEKLPPATRGFMEHRFGVDFSSVRIHAGAEDDRHARLLNAQAFTVGNHIHFRGGRFDPHAFLGRHLLAHELAHTLQQGGGASLIQRKTVADWDAEATALETQILATAEYKALNAVAQGRATWIIAQAKTKPLGDAKGERLYYLKKLLTAITTPYHGTTSGGGYGCSPDTEKKNRDVVDKALKAEQLWGGAYSDVDEKIVATGTNTVERIGEQGKKFTVDRTDPKNIRVKIKVKLNGAPAEVDKIKGLEDAIERSISMTTTGYHVDIVFVDKAGPDDVFEFTVKFCEWPNSGNWASSPVTLSHEVHHALGLPDRYDYIESHAANTDMNVEMRLQWFVEQMKKTGGPRDRFSKMATSSNPLLAEDVCAVAFAAGPDRDKCIQARKSLDPVGVPALP